MGASMLFATYHPTRKPPLRLSVLLRFSLATARPDPDGKPVLLPLKIPAGCVGKGFKCHNLIRWAISDGTNTCNICTSCAEHLWEQHGALSFTVERL